MYSLPSRRRRRGRRQRTPRPHNLHPFPEQLADQVEGERNTDGRQHSEKAAVLCNPISSSQAVADENLLHIFFSVAASSLNEIVKLYLLRAKPFSKDLFQRFLSSGTEPRCCQSLYHWIYQRPCQAEQGRENAAAALRSPHNLSLVHPEIGPLSLAGRLFHSVDLSAGQKKVVSTVDLFRFDAECYSRSSSESFLKLFVFPISQRRLVQKIPRRHLI